MKEILQNNASIQPNSGKNKIHVNISFLEQGWPRSQPNKFLKTCACSRALLDEKCKPVAKHLVLSYELQSIVFGNSIEDLSPTSHLSLTWTDYLRQNHLNRLQSFILSHSGQCPEGLCYVNVGNGDWQLYSVQFVWYSTKASAPEGLSSNKGSSVEFPFSPYITSHIMSFKPSSRLYYENWSLDMDLLDSHFRQTSWMSSGLQMIFDWLKCKVK